MSVPRKANTRNEKEHLEDISMDSHLDYSGCAWICSRDCHSNKGMERDTDGYILRRVFYLAFDVKLLDGRMGMKSVIYEYEK